jgi:predicted nuclease of predicted toxin-antitoxin system
MKMFADENLFEPIIDYLRSLGHDVISIRELGLPGISDDEVYQRACKEKQVIITMDKDFSRMFRFPAKKCGGIIVVKIYKWGVNETLSIFKRFYESLQEKDIVKNLVIITPEGVRIRRSKESQGEVERL